MAENDATAHAEEWAIRNAAKAQGTGELSGCEIYSSCEPGTMCLGAIYWAHLDKLYYGNTKADAKNIGFDDQFIYEELELSPDKRKLPSKEMMHKEALEGFKAWVDNENKIEY